MTQTFNREVIERTIESLRHRFNERGLSEDILERLKANWTKNLNLRMHSNKEEALQRLHELIQKNAQINKEHVEVLQQNAIHEYKAKMRQRLLTHEQGQIIKTDGGFLKAAPKFNPLHSSLITSAPQFLARKQHIQPYAHMMDRSDGRSMDDAHARPMYPSYNQMAPSNTPFSRDPSMIGSRPSYMPMRAMPTYQGTPHSGINRFPSSKALYPDSYPDVVRENSILDGQSRRMYSNPYNSVFHQPPARQSSIMQTPLLDKESYLGPRTHGQMSGQWQAGYDPQKRPRNNDGQESDEDKDADLFADDNDESKEEK